MGPSGPIFFCKYIGAISFCFETATICLFRASVRIGSEDLVSLLSIKTKSLKPESAEQIRSIRSFTSPSVKPATACERTSAGLAPGWAPSSFT